MKNLRRRAVAISVGRRCRPFQFRGGDASLYTLHELDEEEHPVDDDEYEYYEVDHVESAEEDKGDDDSIDYDNNSDKRLISLSKQRNVGMSPLSMRAISSKLSALHQRLGIHHNHNVAFLSLEPFTKFLSLSPHFESSSSSTAAAMVVVGITASLSLWILRTMILHKSWRKLDILHKKRNTHEDDESAKKEKTKHGDKKLMKKKKNKYGDYSTGYPAEGNDDVVDLDEASRETMERYSVRNAWMTTALAPFHLVADWMDGVTFRLTAIAGKIGWLSSIGNALLLFSKTKKRLGPAKTETHTIGKDDAEFMSMTDNEEAPSNQATTEEENNAARILRQQLDTLAEAHESLEQEYEASLRMLHEARMELRRLKSKRSNYNNDDDDDDRDTTKNQQQQQQQIMQDNIQKLEQKYKQQMKEQMERYRNQTEQKLREELAREYESALRSQSEQMAQELQRQKQDYLASPSFRQLVDEASSIQIQEAVAQAVQGTTWEQQARAREEMMRVREGIQQVLDRERRMMKGWSSGRGGRSSWWWRRRSWGCWRKRVSERRRRRRKRSVMGFHRREIATVDTLRDHQPKMIGAFGMHVTVRWDERRTRRRQRGDDSAG